LWQESIYWKIPPPPPGREKISANVIWGGKIQRKKIKGKISEKKEEIGKKKEERGKAKISGK
jgi:hypothetical protein